MKNIGIVYALMAYLIWGVVPIFWRMIDHVPSVEIVAHRILWSSIMVLLMVVLLSQWSDFKALFKQKPILFRLLIASILVSTNWGIYIWAVNTGHIVESSMGYFINPLFNVVLGVLIFKERLRKNQILAIGLAAIGVLYLILIHGEVPYIALSLALTFGCYGALKKSIAVPAIQSMAVETSLLIIPAIGYLIYLSSQNQFSFGVDHQSDIFLVLAGAVTLAPLILFSAAAQKISMTALGMTQYLGPTLQLIIGVWVFNEPFGSERQISFGLIWLGLFFYTADQLHHRRRRRALEGGAGVVVKKLET